MQTRQDFHLRLCSAILKISILATLFQKIKYWCVDFITGEFSVRRKFMQKIQEKSTHSDQIRQILWPLRYKDSAKNQINIICFIWDQIEFWNLGPFMKDVTYIAYLVKVTFETYPNSKFAILTTKIWVYRFYQLYFKCNFIIMNQLSQNYRNNQYSKSSTYYLFLKTISRQLFNELTIIMV